MSLPPVDETEVAAQGEKLQKVLARAGVGSRRDMEKLIAEGRVTVNEKPAQLGDRVDDRDRIAVDGRALRLKTESERLPRVIMYHKPEGEICSARDPEGRPTVFDRLPKVRGERWISIGRLDYNTSGLLLFTNDGELANQLMHPSSGIDREYLCRVLGEVDNDALQRLREGVQLDDGMARFTDITDGGGNGANRWYYVCLMEGRNREVRRLWESQQVKVSRLKRVRYGPIFLTARLKQGRWEDLEPQAVVGLYRMVGLKPPALEPLKPQQKHDRERELGKNPQARRPRPHTPGEGRGQPAERKAGARAGAARAGSEAVRGRSTGARGAAGDAQGRTGRGASSHAEVAARRTAAKSGIGEIILPSERPKPGRVRPSVSSVRSGSKPGGGKPGGGKPSTKGPRPPRRSPRG